MLNLLSLNLLWSEFAETNDRRFDLRLQVLITHWLSVTWPRYWQKYLGVDGWKLVFVITIHGGALLFDVEAGRNVTHSFLKTRSKVSLKFTIILILGAVNNIFHIFQTQRLAYGGCVRRDIWEAGATTRGEEMLLEGTFFGRHRGHGPHQTSKVRRTPHTIGTRVQACSC